MRKTLLKVKISDHIEKRSAGVTFVLNGIGEVMM
jgi:hypothetical protein